MERVEDIAYSIAYEGTGFLLMPIVADKVTKTVIDGNTSGLARLVAHKKYGVNLDMHVIEVDLPKGMSVPEAVQTFNECRNNWQFVHYVLTGINEGKPDFIRLKSMIESIGTPFINDSGSYRWRYATSLSGKNQTEAVKNWAYTLSKKDMEEQIQTGVEVRELWEAGGCPTIGAWFEAFILAYVKAKDFYGSALKFQKLKNHIKEHKGFFAGYEGTKSWTNAINEALTA